MKRRALDNANQLPLGLFVPVVVESRGGGEYLVKPGKPVQRLTVAEAAKLLRRSVDTVYRLYRAGILTGERPSPNGILIDADSVQALSSSSRDLEFWDDAGRRAAYQRQTCGRDLAVS